MKLKVRGVMESLLERFQTANVPQAIAITKFPIPEVPMSNWSYFNQLVCVLDGSQDFRGYKQWHEVNRHVVKGAKATFILVPWMKKKENEKENSDVKEQSEFLCGFLAKPVYKVEETDGEPLAYQQVKLPELPLMDKAKKWGLDVKVNAFQSISYGRFKQSSNEIELATDDEMVFFHELSHYAHSQVSGELKNRQDPAQEIVAEFSAQVLCHIVGKKTNIGYTYNYVESYAKQLGLTSYSAVFKLLGEINKVLDFILQEDANELPN